MQSGMELGLGLLSIGRTWGVRPEPPPTKAQALSLIEEAEALGIRFFDTAPSYGRSEEIFGEYLRARGGAGSLIVATKFGEHWTPDTDQLHDDHTYDALVRSFDRSIERLGRIDILQVHRATEAILASDGVARALEYAKSAGVGAFGASVRDPAAGEAAAQAAWCEWVQIPMHARNMSMLPVRDTVVRRGKRLIVNRPLAMGELAGKGPTHAFRAILRVAAPGVILTGTKSIEHLRENVSAFREALSAADAVGAK